MFENGKYLCLFVYLNGFARLDNVWMVHGWMGLDKLAYRLRDMHSHRIILLGCW